MRKFTKYNISVDYSIIFCICVFFILLAFIFDTPSRIIKDFYTINTSRSVLITDYIALAGIGAALVNLAVTCLFCLFLLIINKREANGRIIAALFVTMGFSLFGKNLFNMLPLLFGIWIHAKVKKVKFKEVIVQAIMSATIAPIVSEVAFLNDDITLLRIALAYAIGMFVGFIFPVVAEAAKRMHRGYCLYNSGVAGGFIATLFVGLLKSTGTFITPEHFWSTSHTVLLAVFAYTMSIALILFGIAADRPVNAFTKFKQLINEKDVRDIDFLVKYGNTCYINIGIMCIISTSIVLLIGIPLNGPVMGGIFTISGFSASGKHLKNSLPILLGSVLATYLNHLEMASPLNALAILFSAGLAPISGKHGWYCGIIVGFLHVSVAIFIGNLNGGLNLYNNGFAEGFLAITIVPLIVFFKEVLTRKKGSELE